MSTPGPDSAARRQLSIFVLSALVALPLLVADVGPAEAQRRISPPSRITPEAYASSALRQRTDAATVAAELRSRYRQRPGQVASVMIRTGWSTSDAARGLGTGLRMEARVVRRTLVESARIPPRTADAAIVYLRGLSTSQVLATMEGAGVALDIVGRGILEGAAPEVRDGLIDLLTEESVLALVGGYAVARFLEETRDSGSWDRVGEMVRGVGWGGAAAARAIH